MSFGELRADPKEWGRFFESAVGAHLINSSIERRFNVYYWNKGDFEVDYVIEQGGIVVGIEVKSGKDSTNKGMALFDEAFRPRGVYIVGTDGIPVEQFLTMNPADLFKL